jgi:hypothetical protein
MQVVYGSKEVSLLSYDNAAQVIVAPVSMSSSGRKRKPERRREKEDPLGKDMTQKFLCIPMSETSPSNP